MRRKTLDALNDLNQLQVNELGNPETLTRMAQYELAFRMQMSVPESDISKETQGTLDAYGAKLEEASFANNRLSSTLSRRWSPVYSVIRLGLGLHGTGALQEFGMDSPIGVNRWIRLFLL